MGEPRDYALTAEQGVGLPGGADERFAGYGVMGLPFRSGHVLGMRRFPASSIGPAYTSVWYRDPDGRWTFYDDVPPLQACNRYFGNAVAEVNVMAIGLQWIGPRSLVVTVPGADLEWRLEAAPTAATRLMNAAGRLVPDALWRRSPVTSAVAPAAGLLLGVGRVGFRGLTPNRQRFITRPTLVWTIPESAARLGDTAFSDVGPLPEQARLGDFWIPQRGVFAVGRAYFEAFDPERHLATPTRAGE